MGLCIHVYSHSLMHPSFYPSIRINTCFLRYSVFLIIENLKIGEILENAEMHEERKFTPDLTSEK